MKRNRKLSHLFQLVQCRPFSESRTWIDNGEQIDYELLIKERVLQLVPLTFHRTTDSTVLNIGRTLNVNIAGANMGASTFPGFRYLIYVCRLVEETSICFAELPAGTPSMSSRVSNIGV